MIGYSGELSKQSMNSGSLHNKRNLNAKSVVNASKNTIKEAASVEENEDSVVFFFTNLIEIRRKQ